MRFTTNISSWIGIDSGATVDVLLMKLADVEKHPVLSGRACLVIQTGACSVHVRPTVKELRELATMLLAAADEQELSQ